MQKATRYFITRHIRQSNLQSKLRLSSVIPNNDFIIKSKLSDIVVPEIPLIERIWRDTHKFRNHVAVECAETGKSFTYDELQSLTASFATSLHKSFGLVAGDVVAAIIPNTPEYPAVVFGCVQAGCVLATINPIYKELEISHQVSLTQPKVVVTVAECYNNVVKGLNHAKVDARIVIIDQPGQSVPEGTIRFSELTGCQADHALLSKIQRKPDDVAFIPFSSGTTGLPKGVEITYRNVLAGIEMMSHEQVNFPNETTATHQDVLPGVLPFFHIYGLVVVMMGHLSQGCKIVTVSKFSPELYFDVLKNKKSSLLYVVPPIVILLSKHPDVGREHLQHVRHVLCGAAPLSAEDLQPLFDKAGRDIKVGQGFGATETTSLTTTTLKSSRVDPAAAGVPMSNIELMFVDPVTGKPVPIGEQGEMLIRGPVVMKGYHKNEKATKESLTADGFYRTGDLGYFKPDVGLYINDRIKELIKVKGMQVAPAELEGVLRNHPAVTDAAVIGVPHTLFGETPKAFVKTKPGFKVSAEDIQDFVASRVATFKKINEVQFVNEIPKTSSGKIMRRELKKMYAS